MGRSIAELTDAELEAEFLEAERNALAWSALGIGVHSEHRGSRWMQIAADLQAEIVRRARQPAPPAQKRRKKASPGSRDR